MNILTQEALDSARYVSGVARAAGATLHLFGIGALALIPWIASSRATSFDSTNWAKSAGFGQIFLPLTRGYNVSHRSTTSTIQRGLSRSDFERLRSVSGHACDFCADFDTLQTSRAARAAHNIQATIDALEILAIQDIVRMRAIYASGSPRYRALWQRLEEPCPD